MTLAAAIADLEKGQSHQEMLAQLRASTVIVSGMADSGYVLTYLASIGKLSALRAVAANAEHPLHDAADAAIVTLETRDGFDFSGVNQVVMLGAFVTAGVLTQAQADEILALGAVSGPEFPGLTLRDVIAVREPTLFTQTHSNVVAVNGAKNRNQLLIVTLGADLPEPVNLQYQVRNKFSGEWSEWEGSSIAGLTNKQSAGIYSARLPGEFIKSTEAEIRVVCPYNVPLTMSVEVA